MPANQEIGARIKDLRELRFVSVEELSQRCGMSAEQIRYLEAGEAASSLTPLLKIARGLGIRLGTLLDDSDCYGPVLSRGSQLSQALRFVGSGEKNGLEFHALAANKRDRNMEPFIITVHPRQSGEAELSSHEGEEFIYVLHGALDIRHGKENYRLEAGDSIYYDSVVPHYVHSADSRDATILAVVYAPN